MKLLKNIEYSLNNENGSPNLEELIGIAYSLGVGTGLFTVGQAMKSWLGKAASSVNKISAAVPT